MEKAKNVSRLAAVLTAGSLLLSASPAFARGVAIGVDASTKTEASLARCQRYEGDARTRCERVVNLRTELKTEHRAMIETRREDRKHTIETVWTHGKATLQRALNAIAKHARRVCSGDETKPVAECMNTVKARVHAEISAMIDIAFTQ